MDATRFDYFTRSITGATSRRTVLGIVALSLSTTTITDAAEAKKKRKAKSKLKRNGFGCVDVGKACRGNSGNCCSGICEGRKPKKGKKDKSRCVAHNVGSCQPEQNACVAPASPCGEPAECYRTTGNGRFCGIGEAGACADCKNDTDCEADFGLGAACVICPPACASSPFTACVPAAPS